MAPKRASGIAERSQALRNSLQATRGDLLELRQDTFDLQEYASAKLERVARYLSILVDKTKGLDYIAQEAESRIAPLKKERRRLFNELLSAKGNVRVFCRVRPQFEHEGHSVLAFPDDCSIRLNHTANSSSSTAAKKEYEFDRVYGPHVNQVSLFLDIQPFVQSVMDGFNSSIICYGQSGSGKTHSMEGVSHDRGFLFRAFNELFDLANSSHAPISAYRFRVSVLEIYNEAITDLLARPAPSSSTASRSATPAGNSSKSCEVEVTEDAEDGSVSVEITGAEQQQVSNPAEFAAVMKAAHQNRAQALADGAAWARDKFNRSHLIVLIRVLHVDPITNQPQASKLLLADLAGSERLGSYSSSSSPGGDKLTESLHVHRALSALGDCLSAISSNKPVSAVPFSNSILTLVLADCMGRDAKTVLLVHCSPNLKDMHESLSTLAFASRARNAELGLGNRDTVKKWRDAANEARREVFDRDQLLASQQQELLQLHSSLHSNEQQARALFTELQRAWLREGQAEAEHRQRKVELEAEVASLLARLRDFEENSDTRLLVQRAQLEAAHEEQMERMLQRHMEEEAGAKVRLEQLEDQLMDAEARASAAFASLEGATAALAAARAAAASESALSHTQQQMLVAAAEERGRARGREEAEARMRDEQQAAVAKYKQELEWSEELNRALNIENASMLARLEATTSALNALESAHTFEEPSGRPRQRGDSPSPSAAAAAAAATAPVPNAVPSDRSGAPDSASSTPTSPPVGDSPTAATTTSARETSVSTTAALEMLVSALDSFNPDPTAHESQEAMQRDANKLLSLVLASIDTATSSHEEGAALDILRRPSLAFLSLADPALQQNQPHVPGIPSSDSSSPFSSPSSSPFHPSSLNHPTATAHPPSSPFSLDSFLVARVRLPFLQQMASKSSELQSLPVYTVDQFLQLSSRLDHLAAAAAAKPRAAQQQQQHPRPFKIDLSSSSSSASSSIADTSASSKRMSASFKLPIKPATFKRMVSGLSGSGGGGTALSASSAPVIDKVRIKEVSNEAAAFAKGNKDLALLFARSPESAVEKRIQRWMKSHAEPWLLQRLQAADIRIDSRLGNKRKDGAAGAASGDAHAQAEKEQQQEVQQQLHQLGTAILHGWLTGLGTPLRFSSDALGQIMKDYSRAFYKGKLQNLQDVSSSLEVEGARDTEHVAKLRIALEAVEHQRKKLLKDMKEDPLLQGLPPQEMAELSGGQTHKRIVSLQALEEILRACREVRREVSSSRGTPSPSVFSSLSSALSHLPDLVTLDRAAAQPEISWAKKSFGSLLIPAGGTKDKPTEVAEAPVDSPSARSGGEVRSVGGNSVEELNLEAAVSSDPRTSEKGEGSLRVRSSPAEVISSRINASDSPQLGWVASSSSLGPLPLERGAANADQQSPGTIELQLPGLSQSSSRSSSSGGNQSGSSVRAASYGSGKIPVSSTARVPSGTSSTDGSGVVGSDSPSNEHATTAAVQWTAMQLNSAGGPLIVKCGLNAEGTLMVKFSSNQSSLSGSLEPDRVILLPSPSELDGLSQDLIATKLLVLPEVLRTVVVAKTANGTRARFSRVYSSLASRVTGAATSTMST